MEKTIKEWLSELPEIQRTQAIDNYEKQPDFCIKKNIDCLSDAIYSAFDWNKTPQGGNFWYDVYNEIEEEEYEQGLNED